MYLSRSRWHVEETDRGCVSCRSEPVNQTFAAGSHWIPPEVNVLFQDETPDDPTACQRWTGWRGIIRRALSVLQDAWRTFPEDT